MIEVTKLAELEQTPHAEVFDQREPRTVRLQLAADDRVPPHTHPGTNIVLYVVEGVLELTLADDQFELVPNDVIRFSGDQTISPRAIEPSTAIIVFAPQSDN